MHIVNEEPPMKSAFKKGGNYSHCPLKKRPVFLFIKEEEGRKDDRIEPENLSTKPEDLTWKPATPPLGVAMISTKPETPERPEHGPLEPLNLNTPEIAWPRPCYPPTYIPYPYQYYYGEKCSSPPQQYLPALPQPRPLYLPFPDCGLSPTSSTSSINSISQTTVYQAPPTPEDLSSPGSVGSTGSWSSRKRSKETSPRYQCNFCNKSYSTYSGLSKHQQFHCSANEESAAKKTFSCKHCDKIYVSLGALKMHIRTHTLPCKCKLCGKAFSRPWLLQGHIRTHTGEKPFTCQHCNRAFADRSNLRAHLQTHSEVKKYSCPTCSKTFSRMSLLTKHTDGGCPGTHHDEMFKHEYSHDITA
ncbi:unnamed protein product [Nezara viridula]|uniref:C2H2-type domain-containing protein n=1 Tax=Nezara viridula TaxID=85310 RepID=A0A9P0GXY2_NEZVI|nr:unnamed protein product [Nezara viridula]